MPTADEQVVVDGQRALAVSEVSGDFIYDGGATDPYCIVDNNGTAQRALKVAKVGEGGGGGGTVDQTYDPTSTNAQSGTAVAEAVAPSLKNKVVAGALNAVVINPLQENDLGVSGTTYNSLIIKNGNQTSPLQQGQTVIGINAGGNYANITCVGNSAQATNTRATVIGSTSNAGGGTGAQGGSATALGEFSNATHGTALGSGTHTTASALAIGRGYDATHRVLASSARSIAIGVVSSTDDSYKVEANAQGAIQLGNGVNSTANSFQVFNYQMLDGTTGLIPAARIGTGYDATKTQVLKNVNGTLTWVDE